MTEHERTSEALLAAKAFVESHLKRADKHDGPYPLWHAWALKKAFLAGFEFGRSWPLGLNPEMDRMAKFEDLSHWSCVSKSHNGCWLRSDGQTVDYNGPQSWPTVLRAFDKKVPLIDE